MLDLLGLCDGNKQAAGGMAAAADSRCLRGCFRCGLKVQN